MKKLINICLVVAILLSYFVPFTSVFAASEYQVTVLKVDGTSESLGTYYDYNEAKNKMNAYNSNASQVAVIYQNGTIINARYAIAKFYSVDTTVNLYLNSGDSTAYTYTNPAYGIDAAFIDYDPSTRRAKIKISGFTGWVSIDTLRIVPITDLSANNIKLTLDIPLRVRNEPTTSGSQQIGTVNNGEVFRYYDKVNSEGYTWYKILYDGKYGWIATKDGWVTEAVDNGLQTFYEPYAPTGNIIHYFEYYGGQTFTNLGPKPSYLDAGTSYYSFDGNYFYEDLVTMLEDYRKSTYDHALNKDNPFYAYYMYLTVHSKTSYTADDLNNVMKNNYGYTRAPEAGVTYVDASGNWISGLDRSGMSAMYNQGQTFIDVQNEYGVNALLSFSTALNESAKGTSALAFAKNNLFGHGAYDSCWFTCATSYNSIKDSIIGHAEMTSLGYSNIEDYRYFGAHYGNKGSGLNVKYASDPYWGEKMAANYYSFDNTYGRQDYLSNTLGIKQSSEDVAIYKEPNTSSSVLYTLKNKYYGFSVTNMPVIVFDKVYENGTWWYMVYTDVALDENRNVNTSLAYDFSRSYGYIEASKIYVSNNQPTISATDLTVEQFANVDLYQNVTAKDTEDGTLTSAIEIVKNNLNTSIPGTYQVTYQVEDSGKFRVQKTINVTVKGSNIPTITANDREVSQYTKFNAKEGVVATDYDGTDITDRIQVSGTVNTDVKDTYQITYTVTNSLGKTATKVVTITVVDNEKPVIHVSNKTVKINSTFDPKAGVTVSDKEDGDLTTSLNVTKNDVDTSEAGTYQVSYEVVDTVGNKTTKTITVTVSDREERNSTFYFDYLKEVDGKLQLKGYSTIQGIDHKIDTNLKYYIVFENVDDPSITYTQDATRITDQSEMTRPVYGVDGKDYTYSWFKVNLDFSNMAQGDYKLYIVVESDAYFSKTLISNKLYKTQVTGFEGEKSIITKNDFNDSEGPVIFYVRDHTLAMKNASQIYNQYDTYRTFEFNGDVLHLKGLTYSYGMNLAANQNVKRTIIFENKETYETYSYDLGSITDGLYPAILPDDDGFDKTRAWYDANIDIRNIPVGEYVIYITTTSNITDISEFTEKLNRSLDQVKKTLNGKSYTFSINKDKGNRIELTVK